MTKQKKDGLITLAELELRIKNLEQIENVNECIALSRAKIDGPLSRETVENLARIFEKRDVTVRLILSVTINNFRRLQSISTIKKTLS